jgi:hypothetical protein
LKISLFARLNTQSCNYESFYLVNSQCAENILMKTPIILAFFLSLWIFKQKSIWS